MKAGWAIAFTLLPGLLYAGPTLAATIKPFDHVFVIVLENKDYNDIIGSSNAPYLNSLAQTYNLATNYSPLVRPSLPNYIAMIGGSTFTIQSNDPPSLQQPISSPSLIDQFQTSGLTWKAYLESLPSVGYMGDFYPNSTEALYAVKHNPFPYFSSVQNNPALQANMVPDTQLATDLANGTVPNFNFIVPNQCNGMHGLVYPGVPQSCIDGNLLVQAGDAKVQSLVTQIMQSSVWGTGNNSIFITWDETRVDPNNRVPMIVINSNGPTGIQDNTAYNHYSLLATVQQGFGLSYLNNAATAPVMANLVAQTSGPTAGVPFIPTPLTALLFGVMLLGLHSRYRNPR